MSKTTVTTEPTFTFWRGLRLSSFQIGSAMGDILVTSIWNRVMISNFGIPAVPVSLLIALRYLLSPLSLWAGYLSDTHPLFRLRRTPYIWLGRGLMVLSLPLLGLSLGRFGANTADTLGWILALASSLMYGIGTLISGSPFLALVRDSAPPKKQGLAISLAETMLIIFFAIVGITFSLWMEVYDQRIFWQMVIATMVVGGFFWFFAILGVEKPVVAGTETAGAEGGGVPFGDTLKRIWADRRTRGFFFFLSLATLAAWAQDAILEPFGADVFDLTAGRTTRFNSYWQAATVVTLVGASLLWRRRPPEQQRPIAGGGLLAMMAGMFVLAAASLSHMDRLIEVGLLIYGAGFGVYTFGGLSLMAVMSSDKAAGAYLGLWTISILVFKGLGTFVGGALRDLFFLYLGLGGGLSYGLVFGLEALGLLTAVVLLRRVDVVGFARDAGRVISRTEAQIAGAD